MGSSNIQTTADIESVLGCGSYQVFIFLIYQFSVFLQCANMAFMSFGKVSPTRWWCLTDEPDGNWTTGLLNETRENITTEWNQTEQCAKFRNGSCRSFRWETDFYSIVPEWQLICDRTGIVYLIMSVQMLGVLLGSPVFGQLSDAYGRKWTLWFSQLILVALDALSIFSPSWEVYLAFRFFMGFSCSGTITISYVYLTEVLKSKHRLWVTSIGGWPPAFAVLAGLAYATRDWKMLSLAISAVGVVPLVMIPLTTESPRWQLQKQKLDNAQRSLERVMKWNRAKANVKARLAYVITSFQENTHPLRTKTKKGNNRQQKYTFWHLCQTRRMAITTAVLNFAFLTVSLVTYGIILNNDKLIGDKYLNFFLFACIRWFTGILTPVIDSSIKSFGRKVTSTGSFALVSLSTLSIALILAFAPDTPVAGKAITGLVLFASMLTSPIWTTLNLTSVEAFPTPIRNIAVGVCAVFNRLGGVIVPLFLYMAELWKPSPFVLFAVVALISSALCAFLLPETKGKALPDRMPPPEDSCCWCCCGKKTVTKQSTASGRSDPFTVGHFDETADW